ncbi:MAG TPA: histone deacetylase family protein [Methylophilus sp.]|nr:histone deacetylase family protein [Methylophilus sp.]HQQ33515.1 histone deacetylase family protein [Methylophilus sp.]
MPRTAFISHPDTLQHVMDGQHPESPARITAIQQAVAASDIHTKLDYYQAPEATKVELKRVHSADYVEYIHRIAPKAGLVRLDGDTAMGPMSLSAALHASGALVLATELVLNRKAANAFCCIRPPGHHAGHANSAGFCIFNNVAVGVAHAMSEYKLKRIAIIDFDVHHGDGTEDIFKDNPNVLLCSTFQHPFYPYRGADSRSDHMINIPLAAKSDGTKIRTVFNEEFEPAIAAFRPELIYISAGFDAHIQDPLADLALSTDDYRWMTETICAWSRKYQSKGVISSLEGGYHLSSLAESALTHIKTLTKHNAKENV